MAELTNEQKQQFINEISIWVALYAPLYNIKCYSAVIAQACLESAYGTSYKAGFHNYFGLKYRENRINCHNGYFEDGGSEQNPDGSYTELPSDTAWYSFENMEKGVKGYFQFTDIENYAAIKGVTDPQTYLENIHEAGYATSLDYVENVMNVITTWNLTQYDEVIASTGYKVAVDAGHGSETAGKRHPDGYREHYSDAYMCFYLEQILIKNGIETLKVSWNDDIVTDDEDIALSDRQAMVKNFGADISVSIHANAYGDGTSYNDAEGVSTHYHSNADYVGDSIALASAIQNQLILNTSQTNRGLVAQELAMCNCTAMDTVASVLVETAFMTNERESLLLQSDEFCRECAREIAQGIFIYLGLDNANSDITLVSAASIDNSAVDISTISGSLDITEAGYYGAENCPVPTLINGSYTLIENTDYNVSYEDNINAGTGKVIITGIGNYTGTLILEFVINPMDITDKVSINCGESDENGFYDMNNIEASCMGLDMIKGIDYTVSFEEYEADPYIRSRAYVTGIGNFTGSGNRSFIIGLIETGDSGSTDEEEPIEPPLLIDISTLGLSLTNDQFNYNGSSIIPIIQTDLVKGTDYTVEYQDNINAGIGKVVVNGIGNYTGTVELEFTINQLSLESSIISCGEPDENGYYNIDNLSIVYYEKELIEDQDYQKTVSYNTENNDEYATVLIVGINNYTGENTAIFKTGTTIVTPSYVDISTLQMQLEQSVFTYSEEAYEPNVIIIDGLYTLEKDKDYNVSYQDNINAGKGKVIITGIEESYYIGSDELEFDIYPRNMAEAKITCGAADEDGCYDLSQIKVELDNIYLTRDTDYTVKYSTEKIDFFVYATIEVTGINNYTGSPEPITVKIERIIININTLGLQFKPIDYEFTGSLIKPILDTELIEGEDYTIEYVESINYGTYKVEIRGINNYTGWVVLSYNITRKSIIGAEISCGEPDENGCYNLSNIKVVLDEVELQQTVDYQFTSQEEELENGEIVSRCSITGINNYIGVVVKQFLTNKKTIYTGKKVELKNCKVFARFGSKSYSKIKSGTYYLWDDVVVNNRVRITNTIFGIGKYGFLTGWVDVDELIFKPVIEIGDTVIVNGKINTSPNGTGYFINREECIMYITDIIKDQYSSYIYGVSTALNRARLGYAKPEQVEKVKG